MKLRHLVTAALGALLLSCQGPAAVLAQTPALFQRTDGDAGQSASWNRIVPIMSMPGCGPPSSAGATRAFGNALIAD